MESLNDYNQATLQIQKEMSMAISGNNSTPAARPIDIPSIGTQNKCTSIVSVWEPNPVNFPGMHYTNQININMNTGTPNNQPISPYEGHI